MEASGRTEMAWVAVLLMVLLALVPQGAETEMAIVEKQKANNCLYNRTLALMLVEYASAVYILNETSLLAWTCSRCQGLTQGFKIHTLVVDVQHCLQAFVGVAEDLNAIVIAFRGTQEKSVQNWVEDLRFKQLDLNYAGVTDAMVHSGFYMAYHNTTLRGRIVTSVQAIQQETVGLRIMVTGHSMGGAMASFCALDLAANYGMENIHVITFGQPRIGNSVFAAFYNELIPWSIRMTHEHDVVPHLPPYYPHMGQRTYHHFATEVWIFKIFIGRLQYEFECICDSSGEDPTCSRLTFKHGFARHSLPLSVAGQPSD